MNSRWTRANTPLRTLRCAVVEVPAMNDPRDRSRRDDFCDLVPWADPYIAALVDKLRRSAELLEAQEDVLGELPPPLDSRDDDREDRWPHDWKPRSWPRD
jgi:hypothetical protein